MDEKYRLVFRGEVLDGQHRAVVKRRLVESLKLSEAQAEKLFSGSAVVLKKSVEAKVAARYQALFKQAGGRLRVHPVSTASTDARAAEDKAPAADKAPAVDEARAAVQESPALEEPAPTGAGNSLALLSQEDVDRAAAALRTQRPVIQAPEFSLADLGADLAEPGTVEVPVIPEAQFSLAEPGVDLLIEKPEVEISEVKDLDVDLADLGATLVEPSSDPAPAAPDISHIELAEPA